MDFFLFTTVSSAIQLRRDSPNRTIYAVPAAMLPDLPVPRQAKKTPRDRPVEVLHQSYLAHRQRLVPPMKRTTQPAAHIPVPRPPNGGK